MNASDGPCLTCGETRTRPAPRACGDKHDHVDELRNWVIPLSFARPPLNLNKQLHHMVKYRVKKQIKDEVILRAVHGKLPKGLGKVRVLFHYAPARGGAHDEDNLAENLKPGIDGLVRYGLVQDDSYEYVTSGVVIEPKNSGVYVNWRLYTCWLTIDELEI